MTYLWQSVMWGLVWLAIGEAVGTMIITFGKGRKGDQ